MVQTLMIIKKCLQPQKDSYQKTVFTGVVLAVTSQLICPLSLFEDM